MAAVDYRRVLTFEPGKRSGQPCIRGIRITVGDVLSYLAGGMSPEEIVEDFPDLTVDDVRACLAFAADREDVYAAIAPEVDRILREVWDPIGVNDQPEARDEYRTYVPAIVSRLVASDDEAKIAGYLNGIAAERMGISPPPTSADAAAQLSRLVRKGHDAG